MRIHSDLTHSTASQECVEFWKDSSHGYMSASSYFLYRLPCSSACVHRASMSMREQSGRGSSGSTLTLRLCQSSMAGHPLRVPVPLPQNIISTRIIILLHKRLCVSFR